MAMAFLLARPTWRLAGFADEHLQRNAKATAAHCGI